MHHRLMIAVKIQNDIGIMGAGQELVLEMGGLVPRRYFIQGFAESPADPNDIVLRIGA
jgi:hypothetical protein